MPLNPKDFPNVIRFLKHNVSASLYPSADYLIDSMIYDLQNPIDIYGTLEETEQLLSRFSDLELTQFVEEHFGKHKGLDGRYMLEVIERNLVQTGYELAFPATPTDSPILPKASWLRKFFQRFQKK